jgi:hypothetical protein
MNLIARHMQEKEAINDKNISAQAYLEDLDVQAVPSEKTTDPFVKAIHYIFWNLTESQQSRRHLVEERVTSSVSLAIKQNSSLPFQRLCSMIYSRLTFDKDSVATMIVDGIIESLITILSQTQDSFVKMQISLAFLHLSAEAANSVINTAGTSKVHPHEIQVKF